MFSNDLHVCCKIKLVQVVGDSGTTLTGEHIHVIITNRKGKVATSRWYVSLLVNLKNTRYDFTQRILSQNTRRYYQAEEYPGNIKFQSR